MFFVSTVFVVDSVLFFIGHESPPLQQQSGESQQSFLSAVAFSDLSFIGQESLPLQQHPIALL